VLAQLQAQGFRLEPVNYDDVFMAARGGGESLSQGLGGVDERREDRPRASGAPLAEGQSIDPTPSRPTHDIATDAAVKVEDSLARATQSSVTRAPPSTSRALAETALAPQSLARPLATRGTASARPAVGPGAQAIIDASRAVQRATERQPSHASNPS